VSHRGRKNDEPFAVACSIAARLTEDRLYVPIAGGGEELAASNPSYVCCKFRGSVAALDAKTGKQIWESYTIGDPARMTGKTDNGTDKWGPSGAAVWSSPNIDSDLHANRVQASRAVAAAAEDWTEYPNASQPRNRFANMRASSGIEEST
jgi:polyvinyl alcohol dehydrogenase (cytochrome)